MQTIFFLFVASLSGNPINAYENKSAIWETEDVIASANDLAPASSDKCTFSRDVKSDRKIGRSSQVYRQCKLNNSATAPIEIREISHKAAAAYPDDHKSASPVVQFTDDEDKSEIDFIDSDADSFSSLSIHDITGRHIIPVADRDGTELGTIILHGKPGARATSTHVPGPMPIIDDDIPSIRSEEEGEAIWPENSGTENWISGMIQNFLSIEASGKGTNTNTNDTHTIEYKSYSVKLHWSKDLQKEPGNESTFVPTTIRTFVKGKSAPTVYCLDGYFYTDRTIAYLHFEAESIVRYHGYNTYQERDFRQKNLYQEPLVWAEFPDSDGYILVKRFKEQIMVNQKGQRFDNFEISAQAKPSRKKSNSFFKGSIPLRLYQTLIATGKLLNHQGEFFSRSLADMK